MPRKFESESWAMRLFRAAGADSIAWPLRRLHCPVDPKALVLEVGSGGNPYPRSNVLVDAFETTRERHWAPLIADRPTVLAFGEKLPFRDKAFDFVIASHVLEHSSAPDQFLAELQRVGKAGYIETPDAFFERLNPYRDHRLEVGETAAGLVIRKKPAWIVDQGVVDLYERNSKAFFVRSIYPQNPFAFHVRHYWSERIKFSIINPETDASWKPTGDTRAQQTAAGKWMRQLLTKVAQKAFTQSRRNAKLDVVDLLRCPSCQADRIGRRGTLLVCGACGSSYDVKGALHFMVQNGLAKELESGR